MQAFLVVNIDEEGELIQRGVLFNRKEAEALASTFTFGLVIEAIRCEQPLPIVKEANKYPKSGEKSVSTLVVDAVGE